MQCPVFSPEWLMWNPKYKALSIWEKHKTILREVLEHNNFKRGLGQLKNNIRYQILKPNGQIVLWAVNHHEIISNHLARPFLLGWNNSWISLKMVWIQSKWKPRHGGSLNKERTGTRKEQNLSNTVGSHWIRKCLETGNPLVSKKVTDRGHRMTF